MTSPATAIEQLRQVLPGLDWITDPQRVARLSQDFNWFSPVLKRALQGKSADTVARPRNEEEIRQLVSHCARLSIPITLRGGGTGNYGQAVPLQGGLVLDMSACNAFLWSRPGVGRAQAGIRLADLDRATQPGGWELRCLPSTYRSATLGGLFGGGFGGVGSITYGPLGAAGNVLGIRAMTVEPEPQVIELRGAEALQMHHVYGCNGLVLELEVGLAPAHDWLENIVTFSLFEQALAFADALAHASGIVKKEVALLADPVPRYMATLAEVLPAGCHAVLLLVAGFSEAATLELVAQHGGQVSYRKTAAEVRASNRTLVEYTWNHTTLHALKVDKSITYLQSFFAPGQHLAQVRRMQALLGDEVLLHLEFLRGPSGETTCTGLQLVRYSSDERLNQIIALFEANGVRINNPHAYVLEDGKSGGGALPDEVIAMKRRFDPAGLLNPGKLRAWPAGNRH